MLHVNRGLLGAVAETEKITLRAQSLPNDHKNPLSATLLAICQLLITYYQLLPSG
jgi:hypothetical protein